MSRTFLPLLPKGAKLMGSKGLTVGQIIDNKVHLPETPESGEGAPAIPQDLLDFLDRIYPLSQPSILDTERAIWFRYGQTSVVDNLKQWKEIELQRHV